MTSPVKDTLFSGLSWRVPLLDPIIKIVLEYLSRHELNLLSSPFNTFLTTPFFWKERLSEVLCPIERYGSNNAQRIYRDIVVLGKCFKTGGERVHEILPCKQKMGAYGNTFVVQDSKTKSLSVFDYKTERWIDLPVVITQPIVCMCGGNARIALLYENEVEIIDFLGNRQKFISPFTSDSLLFFALFDEANFVVFVSVNRDLVLHDLNTNANRDWKLPHEVGHFHILNNDLIMVGDLGTLVFSCLNGLHPLVSNLHNGYIHDIAFFKRRDGFALDTQGKVLAMVNIENGKIHLYRMRWNPPSASSDDEDLQGLFDTLEIPKMGPNTSIAIRFKGDRLFYHFVSKEQELCFGVFRFSLSSEANLYFQKPMGAGRAP